MVMLDHNQIKNNHTNTASNIILPRSHTPTHKRLSCMR